MACSDDLGLDLDVAHAHAGQRASVPIGAGRVQRDLLAEHQIGQRSLGCLPERLPTLVRVDAVDADVVLLVALVQAGDRVTVRDVDDTPLDGIGGVLLRHDGHETDGGDEGRIRRFLRRGSAERLRRLPVAAVCFSRYRSGRF